MEEAERVNEGVYIGECDKGDLWVETMPPAPWWQTSYYRRFNAWSPIHLYVYWRSRRARKVLWLERASR